MILLELIGGLGVVEEAVVVGVTTGATVACDGLGLQYVLVNVISSKAISLKFKSKIFNLNWFIN